MNAPRIVCDDCPVASRAACSTLTPGDRALLAAAGQRRHYARGETILAAGDDATVCATITRGAAKLSTIDAQGRERIVALAHPAGMVGQMFGASQTLHVTALTETDACLFPRDRFARLADEHPALTRRMLADAHRALDESRVLIDLISKREAKGRVAALLLAFSRAASDAPCHDTRQFDLPLTRGEIAEMLGVTIETVSRTLTAFEQAGLIRRVGICGIAIDDRPRLETVVDGGGRLRP